MAAKRTDPSSFQRTFKTRLDFGEMGAAWLNTFGRKAADVLHTFCICASFRACERKKQTKTNKKNTSSTRQPVISAAFEMHWMPKSISEIIVYIYTFAPPTSPATLFQDGVVHYRDFWRPSFSMLKNKQTNINVGSEGRSSVYMHGRELRVRGGLNLGELIFPKLAFNILICNKEK